MRIHRRRGPLVSAVLVVALGTGLASVAVAQTPAPYVKVLVDGAPVYFTQAPVMARRRVLVPLRGVFEHLGATVTWDPGAQGVFAQRGATSVSLWIGATQAFVNGQARVLDAPPMLIGGYTMIPLRFVSQALGANVNWDGTTSTVQITSQDAPAAPPVRIPPSVNHPPVQAVPSYPFQIVRGAVTRVNAFAHPGRLTVQTPGGTYTYWIVSRTAITRIDPTTGVSRVVGLRVIQPGNVVIVTANQTGTAESVQASSGVITGTVASTGYDQIVRRDGQTYTLAPILRIRRRGQPITAAALQPGDVVTLHVDPQTGQVDRIAVRRAASPGVSTSVTVTPARRELVAGNVMTVVAAGPADGAATFAITGLRTGLPMTESTNQPGRYIGTYAIQPGDFVANGTVAVTFTAPGGQLLTATAPVPVWINTSAIIPPAVGGAPVITSPMPGSAIATPFAATGTAPPGSLVKVTAHYAGNVLLVNIRGTLGSQTVIADANGNWSATFSQAPPVRGVNVTIAAGLVDYTGAARSPSMIVNNTLN